MSGVLGKCQSNAPNIQLLEEERAARSIVVSNISPQTTKEGVMIHFQRRRNGGGEIDHIHLPKKGSAVITFERGEVIETVLEQSHTLNGSILKLHRLIPDDSFEVLQRVEARINFDRFPQSSQDWKKKLEVLKDETEVKCRQLFDKEYVLCGTFSQISTAQMLLQGILQKRSSVLQQSRRGYDAIHQVDTTQTQQNSSEVCDIDILNTSAISSFEVQPQFMKFLQQVYKNKLQEIEETHGVKIVWIENASQVQIHSSEILNYPHPHSYQTGCDAFIDLYQKLYPNMGREEVDISADSRGLIIEDIKTVESENQVLIEINGNKLLVFAEKNNITRSVQALKEALGSLQGGSRKTNTNRGVREHENGQEVRFPVLKQLLDNGVKLSLYQSDITNERVDAIVNAANDGLLHGGGVAAAIAQKGGHQIQEQSRQIMFNRNYRPLNVGDAVYTRGGNLYCQFVIHTVGPRWNAHEEKRCTSLLRRACVESLRLAAKLKLCSIALPAISSGIFGMPKNICARGMLQAMEEFSSSTDAEISTLRDVRIVIIDHKTIDVFREVFVNRYTYPETSLTTSPNQERHPRRFDEEQGPSSALNFVANHLTLSSADNWSDEPSKKNGKDKNDVESPSKRVDPNAENNEPPNGEQESPSALSVDANQPAFFPSDNRSDKPPKKTGGDINDIDSLSKGLVPNAENNEAPDEEQESSSALSVDAKHPAFFPSDNRSDKPPKKTGEDINDVDSSRKGVDPNAENNEPPNGQQGSPSALGVDANRPAFFSADNRSEKTPKKTGKDISDVDSLSKGVDPKAENNEPPNGEQESSSALHVDANRPVFFSSDNQSDKPPKKTGEDTNDADSLTKGVDLNAENSEHPKKEQESSSALNVVANHPACSLADNWSDTPSKKTGEDNDSDEALGKAVDPNAQNNESGKQIPDSIKEGLSVNINITSPVTDAETSNADTEVNALVKGREFSNMSTAFKPLRGRGKGIAAKFSGRSQGETESKSRGSTQVPWKTGETKSVNTGGGRGMTYAAINSPPGLSVTEEGQHLAREHANRVKGDQNTDPAALMTEKEESERNESKNGAIEDENQELKEKYHQIDKDKFWSKSLPSDGITNQEETRPSNDGIVHPKKAEETMKNTVEKPPTDDKRSRPLDENINNTAGPMQPDKMPNKGMEVDHASSSAVNNGASFLEEQLPPSLLETSPEAEAIAPTAYYGSVTVQDTGKERQAKHADVGSEPLFKMRTTFPTGEANCSMCMNLNKDPVYPVNCGHYFCKSCTRRFIEKTMICSVCKKENLFRGNQPVGYMTWRNESSSSLPGYEKFGTILLTFNFDSGIQGTEHPNPGEPYRGLFCTSYLPNDPVGQEVCNLLRSAFDTRLIFTIGKCLATGEENRVVFNGIELKTNRSGGPTNFGYPDPSYLDRVKSQLAEKGITQPFN